MAIVYMLSFCFPAMLSSFFFFFSFTLVGQFFSGQAKKAMCYVFQRRTLSGVALINATHLGSVTGVKVIITAQH